VSNVIIAGRHSPTVSIILLSLLMLEAVIFGIFTGVMFFNQMWAVGTDETVSQCSFKLSLINLLLLTNTLSVKSEAV